MKKWINRIKNLPSLYYFIFCIVAIWLGFSFREQYYLQKCHKYVLGKYIESFSIGRGCRQASFEYSFHNRSQIYNECQDEELTKGDIVFLKIACTKDGLGKVMWDILVPDTLTFVPANGWDNIPYGLNNLENE